MLMMMVMKTTLMKTLAMKCQRCSDMLTMMHHLEASLVATRCRCCVVLKKTMKNCISFHTGLVCEQCMLRSLLIGVVDEVCWHVAGLVVQLDEVVQPGADGSVQSLGSTMERLT